MRDIAVSYRCACGVALKSQLGPAYNEEAFQYLLAIERTRSERSGRPFLLLMVDLKEQPGGSARIDSTIAGKLFRGLSHSLRETDFIGWYGHERAVGAVLPEFRAALWPEVSHRVRQRVHGALCQRLSTDVACRLQVRVYGHHSPERIDSGRPRTTGAELLLGEI